MSPTTAKIMLIRHAEKPTTSIQGVNFDGKDDPESLIVQGWQRAGALVTLFDPFRGALQNTGLATPDSLYASSIRKKGQPKDGDSKSERPVETITPLSQRLNQTINENYGKADIEDLVQEITQLEGTVLVCWQHEAIPAISNLILKNTSTVPQTWPGDRFDLVWVFDLNPQTGTYSFAQIPQNLIAGDSNTPIS